MKWKIDEKILVKSVNVVHTSFWYAEGNLCFFDGIVSKETRDGSGQLETCKLNKF